MKNSISAVIYLFAHSGYYHRVNMRFYFFISYNTTGVAVIWAA